MLYLGELFYSSELYVGDDEQASSKAVESEDILPQVPTRLIRNTLLFQIRVLISFDATRYMYVYYIHVVTKLLVYPYI